VPTARRPTEVELSDEKSKKSLSEIYEEAYLREKERQAAEGPAEASSDLFATAIAAAASKAKESSTATEEEAKAIVEIKKQMSQLFSRLDELTNFHYTPPEPAADVQIIANVPAIAVEEKLPAALSDAARLAPEEVYAKPTVLTAVCACQGGVCSADSPPSNSGYRKAVNVCCVYCRASQSSRRPSVSGFGKRRRWRAATRPKKLRPSRRRVCCGTAGPHALNGRRLLITDVPIGRCRELAYGAQ